MIEKDRDAYESWRLAIAELRKRGIRAGEIAPLDDHEWREAWLENQSTHQSKTR